jgi:ATP-dependent exoDNAse (exonuclease V) alpha subunit
VLPAEYANKFVELAYATTVHGAQGETVDRAHVALGDTTGATAAYVAMTRGRERNTAHLVAESVEDARRQWVEVFARDRADLGPAHAKRQAIEAIDRYGGQQRRRPAQKPVEEPPRPVPSSGSGIGLGDPPVTH